MSTTDEIMEAMRETIPSREMLSRQQILDDVKEGMRQLATYAPPEYPRRVVIIGGGWTSGLAFQTAVKEFESTGVYKVVVKTREDLRFATYSDTLILPHEISSVKAAPQRHGPQPHHSKKSRHREFKTKKGNGRK